MKKLSLKTKPVRLVCFLLSAISLFACPVLADDGVGNWSGGYVGLHGGGAWSDFSNTGGASSSGSDSNFTGGAQIGSNMQLDRLIFGLEGDISWLDLQSRNSQASFDEDYMVTLRGRAGIAMDRIMPYVTAGVAFTDAVSKAPGQGKSSRMQPGTVVGAGVDIMMDKWAGDWAHSGKWIGRVEYLHVDVPEDDERVGNTTVRGGSQNNIVRVALNYKF